MIVFQGAREPIKAAWLSDPIVQALNLLAVWSARHGIDIIITSMNDHKHKRNSLHGRDLALDFVVEKKQIRGGDIQAAMTDVSNYLKGNLGLGWDCLWNTDAQHKDHCHIEFDVKQRRGAWRTNIEGVEARGHRS